MEPNLIPSPFMFDGTASLDKIPDRVFNNNILTRAYLVSFKRNPQLVFEFNAKSSLWKGIDEAWVSPQVRGKLFGGMTSIQQELAPSDAELAVSNFFVIDKLKRIITTTTMKRTTAKSKSQHESKPTRDVIIAPSGDAKTSEKTPIEVKSTGRKSIKTQGEITETPPLQAPSRKRYKAVTVTPVPPQNLKPQSGDMEVVLVTSIREKDTTIMNDKKSEEPDNTLRSVFLSTETIEQRYKPDPSLISQVNGYDQHNETFLCRYWMTDTELASRNLKWNSVGSCYALFYYISKILKWPLEEVRVVVNYDTNAVKFSSVIGQVYKLYKIEDKFAESTILTKFLVWCIASMNSFGVIRPMIFKGTSGNHQRMTELCASKQTYERILYYVTWPFRVDANKIYVILNRTKLHEVPLKTTFLSDLHVESNTKKLLKDIPDWVYTLVKRS